METRRTIITSLVIWFGRTTFSCVSSIVCQSKSDNDIQYNPSPPSCFNKLTFLQMENK